MHHNNNIILYNAFTLTSHAGDISKKTTTADAGPHTGYTPLPSSSAGPTGLRFSEVKGDLFSCPDSASLAHCVSEDLHMGKGVATLFKQKFGGVGELKSQGKIMLFSMLLAGVAPRLPTNGVFLTWWVWLGK